MPHPEDLTRLDMFAAAALQGLLAGRPSGNGLPLDDERVRAVTAEVAVNYAVAMVLELDTRFRDPDLAKTRWGDTAPDDPGQGDLFPGISQGETPKAPMPDCWLCDGTGTFGEPAQPCDCVIGKGQFST